MVHAYQCYTRARCRDVQQFSRKLVLSLLATLCVACPGYGQADTATVSGVITDQSGAVVASAEVRVTNTETNITWTATSNGSGVYLVTGLKPGRYRIHVAEEGFKGIDLTDLILNVQDSVSRNFTLQVGSTSESVSVEGDRLQINTQDASVSTVVDRQFAENLPLNGRSFQTLIELTPGVVPTANAESSLDSGQFSVNGQRASSNYWMVDGVSANFAASTAGKGNQLAGAIGATSVFGGTNSLVSVDALQEFRIQTSTFAPEFGRTPGAQISIVTRSGTNQFHGTVFDYLRNDAVDANNWFANATQQPKPEERQNDFGGTFSGPVVKDRAFFFFSYEGLRLRLPQVALSTVPDLSARQNALPAIQPYVNAYPLPNGPDNAVTGVAQLNASYSNPATLDAYSFRIDGKLTDKLNLFGRYNYSPSEIRQRGPGTAQALSSVLSSRNTIQTATIGSTWMMSNHATNELRVNYSRSNASSINLLDSFGGAVPLTSLGLPSPFTAQNAFLGISVASLSHGFLQAGPFARNLQQQFNIVDTVNVVRGSHDLKFGVDYRRLSPEYSPFFYQQFDFFRNVISFENGTLFPGSRVSAASGATFAFNNLSAFVQDTWHVLPRLMLTYGVRWDNDFSPSSSAGPNFPAVTGFNLSDLSGLALAPVGTSPFKNRFANFAPRVGVAYQLSPSPNWATVARGGFGVFYDLATSEAANLILKGGYPFISNKSGRGGSFPLSSAAAAPPPIQPPSAQNPGDIAAFDPNLKLPYTLQWNVALEQELGEKQSVSATYVGAVGRRLLQSSEVFFVNPTINHTTLVANTATSDYHALQVQFKRQLSRGFQALASYTFSHSIDTASAGSTGVGPNAPATAMDLNANRGSSDFDIRHAFSAGVTYAIPSFRSNGLAKAITGGWSLQNIIQAHSATPLTVIDANFGQLTNGFATDVRPDVIPGIPLYLYGSQYPGGKAINFTPGAVAGGCSDGSQSVGPFCPPPQDVNGNPLRNGDFSRNSLRGFGLFQWDLSVHRDFRIHESLVLQFRVEMFNVTNHPNFAPPVNDISGFSGPFGLSNQTLAQYLGEGAGGAGIGTFNPLYQIGGPRSMQFALKLSF